MTDSLKSSLPRYEQVRRQVVRFIAERNLQPGDRLPSDRRLAEYFGFNHRTIRKGLRPLVEHGIIERQVGSGTFLRVSPATTERAPGASRDDKPTKVCLGLLLHLDGSSYLSAILKTLHIAARERDVELAIRTAGSKPESLLAGVRQLVQAGARCVIIPWLPGAPSPQSLEPLVAEVDGALVLPKPVPGLEPLCYETPAAFEREDNYPVQLIGTLLQRAGYGHIAFFGPGFLERETVRRRLEAYRQFIQEAQMTELTGRTCTRHSETDALIERWKRYSGDLAVFCFDDEWAISLMTALHRSGIAIPEEIAVVGFNNIPLAARMTPPLTSVQFDYIHVARCLVEHALGMLHGGRPPLSGVGHPSLVIRESCGLRRRLGAALDTVLEEVVTSVAQREPVQAACGQPVARNTESG